MESSTESDINELIRKRDWKNVIQHLCRYDDHHKNFDKKNKEDPDQGRGIPLLLKKDKYGWNPLHYACRRSAPVEVVAELIRVGGKDLVLEKNKYGWNSLHYACQHKASVQVISKLVEAGGRDLVLEKSKYDGNPLHHVCRNNASTEVISKLVQVGGRDLVLLKNIRGWTALHYLSFSNNACNINSKILDLFIAQGGEEVFSQKNTDQKTPLHVLISQDVQQNGQENNRELVKKASLIMNKGIELRIGGEFGIGGLFNLNDNDKVQGNIFVNWNELVLPALKDVMVVPHSHAQPILQAFIINEAPSHIIKDIVIYFTKCVFVKDSLGRFPIDVAVQYNLTWDDGMKEIIDSFTSLEQYTAINECARHGLSWENGMSIVLEENNAEDMEKEDEITGLYPFMLSAVGGKYFYDLASVFHLIKKCPRLVDIYCSNGREKSSKI